MTACRVAVCCSILLMIHLIKCFHPTRFRSPRLLTQLMCQRQLVVVIAGPTASGKSDVAAEICDIIVSADSVQAYQGVNVGANKPTPTERKRTPHLLVDVAEASMNYNAANWCEDALFCIKEIAGESSETFPDWEQSDRDPYAHADREKIVEIIRNVKQQKGTDTILPVVVGGTMMYLQWLVHGRPDAVKPTQEALTEAKAIMERFEMKSDWKGAKEYVMSQGDVFTAPVEKLFDNDYYRLRRILEVALTVKEDDNDDVSQQKLYSGLREGGLVSLGFDVRCFFLCPDERMAHTKIVDGRCEDMICRGLINETTDLTLTGAMPEMAAKAIGYRQTLEYLERDAPKDQDGDAFAEYVEKFAASTRQYAKRQMQWFRRDKDFMFVPVKLSIPKTERVSWAANEVKRLISLSREDYDKERLDEESTSSQARRRNEEQGKGMKVYQFQLQRLLPGSKAFEDALSGADACTHRFQGKKAKTNV